MKFKILIILLFSFCFLFSCKPVSAIGVGAKPSVLDLELKAGQSEKTKILVYNLSQEAGIFQVFPDELKEYIEIKPDNFRLEAGESKEIKITVLVQEDGKKTTNLSVLGMPLDRRSFSVSSGIKIPLRLNVQKRKLVLSAAILHAISENWVWILGMLAILFFIVKYFKKIIYKNEI